MPSVPPSYADLLTPEAKTFAWLATLQPDGTPQVTPVWFDVADGKIRINTAKGRVKFRNMVKNGNVAIGIGDPANPYRYVQVRGRVVEHTEVGADAHIDSLAMKYMGVDSYPFRTPDEVRVMFVIEPGSYQAMG